MTSLLADCVIEKDTPREAWSYLWDESQRGALDYERDHVAWMEKTSRKVGEYYDPPESNPNHMGGI